MQLAIFSVPLQQECIFCCCDLADYNKHKLDTWLTDSVIKGVSTETDECVEDFVVNYFMATGESITLSLDNIILIKDNHH